MNTCVLCYAPSLLLLTSFIWPSALHTDYTKSLLVLSLQIINAKYKITISILGIKLGSGRLPEEPWLFASHGFFHLLMEETGPFYRIVMRMQINHECVFFENTMQRLGLFIILYLKISEMSILRIWWNKNKSQGQGWHVVMRGFSLQPIISYNEDYLWYSCANRDTLLAFPTCSQTSVKISDIENSHSSVLLMCSFAEGYLYSWCCWKCWDKADKIHYHHSLRWGPYLSIWCVCSLLKSSFHPFLLTPHSWLSRSC